YLGNTGTGKSRALKLLSYTCCNVHCVKAGFSASALFRRLHKMQPAPTMIVDEGDFSKADETHEITKILNAGFEKDGTVEKSIQTSDGKDWEPKQFRVYGPKIIGTRRHYKDEALENRCITFLMGEEKVPRFIPEQL